MMKTRPPAVAGTFYSANPATLKSDVEHYLSFAKALNLQPRAVISPHAGYVYSGQYAGTAYGQFLGRSSEIDRVVLIGPAHREYVEGIAATSAIFFQSPLGEIPIDTETLNDLMDNQLVHTNDQAHKLEHSLEVQLPFLQLVLNDFRLTPLLVGNADPASIAGILLPLMQESKTLIVISSDLSHYLDYKTATAVDSETSAAIEALEPARIVSTNACGSIPIKAMLLAAKRLGLHARTLSQGNSGDTAGDKNRVVGYGAYLFH